MTLRAEAPLYHLPAKQLSLISFRHSTAAENATLYCRMLGQRVRPRRFTANSPSDMLKSTCHDPNQHQERCDTAQTIAQQKIERVRNSRPALPHQSDKSDRESKITSKRYWMREHHNPLGETNHNYSGKCESQNKQVAFSPAERARQIEDQERRAESHAALQRALAYAATKRAEERDKVDTWLGREAASSQCGAAHQPKAKRYKHDGLSLTLFQWAERTGIDYDTIHTRLRLGWSFADAVTYQAYQTVRRQYELNGKSQSLKDWAKQIGVKENTLLQRIRRGMPFAEALAYQKPPRGSKAPGVAPDFARSLGTGGGSTAQESTDLNFSQEAAE